MSKALINSEMLVWGSERAGVDAEALADRMGIRIDRVHQWLSGEDSPTFRQAQEIAKALNLPFGFLFLDRPPEDVVALPDLRTVGSDPARNLDHNFKDLLKDILFKVDWFKEYLKEIDGDPLPFVGSFKLGDPTKAIAANMREVLFGPSQEIPPARNWEDFLTELMRAAEGVGVWVMRNGVVGSNTRRPLSVAQFRGFAIADPVAPLIFINGRDAKAAQIFTLAHELAHIWLGATGISNVEIGKTDFGVHSKIERKCNEVAAEFLVPEASLRASWMADVTFASNLDANVRRYRVSRIVIGRRAFDLGLCAEDDYRRLYAIEQASWDRESEETGGGGDFYRTLPIRNGARFTRSVVNQAAAGQLLLSHAATLLNAQPAALMKFHKRQQVA